MAEIADSTLQIKVEANTSEAKKELESLKQKINEIVKANQTLTNNLNSQISSLSKQFSSVTQSLASVTKELNLLKSSTSTSIKKAVGGNSNVSKSDMKKDINQLKEYEKYMNAIIEDSKAYDNLHYIGPSGGDTKKIEELYKKFNEKRNDVVNPLTGEVINMTQGYAEEFSSIASNYNELSAKLQEYSQTIQSTSSEEYISIKKRIKIWDEYQNKINSMFLSNTTSLDDDKRKVLNNLFSEQEKNTGFIYQQNRDSKGRFRPGKQLSLNPDYFRKDYSNDVLSRDRMMAAYKRSWTTARKESLSQMYNYRQQNGKEPPESMKRYDDYLMGMNPYDIGDNDSFKGDFNEKLKQRAAIEKEKNKVLKEQERIEENLYKTDVKRNNIKKYDGFRKINPEWQEMNKKNKQYQKQNDYLSEYMAYLDQLSKKGSGRVSFFSIKNMSRRLIIYKAINMAIKLTTDSLKLAFTASKEIFDLYKSANQSNLLVSQFEQLTYLTKQLGMNYAQLDYMITNDTETITKMLQKYKDLGGLISDEELKNATSLANKMNDLSTAWQGFKYTWQNTFYGLNSMLVDALTAVVDAMNGTETNIADVSEETAKALQEALYTSGLLKRQLMGFDEVNIISTDSLTAIENYKRAVGEISTDVQSTEQKTNYTPNEGSDAYKQEQENLKRMNEEMGKAIFLSNEWWKNMGDKFSNWVQSIKNSVSHLGDWISQKTYGILSGFGPMADVINALVIAIEWVINTIGDAARILWGALELLGGVVKGFITKDWGWFKQGWENIWKGFLNIFIDLWNNFADNLTLMWQSIGRIGFDLPKWLGGGSWHLNDGGWFTGSIKKLPRLADGGVIYQPTVAMMGEYAGAASNPEIVTPQSLLKETLAESNGEMANIMAQCTRQLIACIENKDLSVSIGDKDVAEATNRYNNAYRKMTGKALLTI